MKKKQRCFLKRFAALVAALVICSAFCVPCFASNNASSQKWVVIGEEQLIGENGQLTRYFHLTPYDNGSVYSAVITSSYYRGWQPSLSSSNHFEAGIVNALNYPDWWRAALPLGANSYIEIFPSSFRQYDSLTSSSYTSLSSASLYAFDSANSLVTVLTGSGVASSQDGLYDFSLSTPNSVCPAFIGYWANLQAVTGNAKDTLSSTSIPLSLNKSTRVRLSSINNVVLSAPFVSSGSASVLWGANYAPLSNLSSDRLVLACDGASNGKFTQVIAQISFWVDANKLPAGLQVGDEFPANTDAFDQLRDELLKQFPEAADNIENGKATIQGWNDTETVDTDVASTSISALNAMFQNLGGFLFIVSLMVFGAVVLRMLIRKAVDG